MTKTTTASSSRRNSGKGGRAVKTDNGAANVAPEGNTVEQPQEVADAIVAEAEGNPAEVAPAESPESEVELPEGTTLGAASDELPEQTAANSVVDGPTDEDAKSAPAETEEAAEVVVAPEPVDPFANLPMTKIEDYEFRDFATAETSDPRKYTEVQKAAIEGKLPIKPNWKYKDAMVTAGRQVKEFREGSVWGTIDQIVRSYGRAGVPAYVLVPKVRQLQIGNKRSHYCTGLPPIGWAEGWIDTYISKAYGKVMEKKAPLLTAEVKQELLEGEVKAEAEAARQAA
jgi:hypothetical protein